MASKPGWAERGRRQGPRGAQRNGQLLLGLDVFKQGPGTVAVDLVAVTPLNEKCVLLVTMEGGRELLASEAGDRDVPRRTGPSCLAVDLDAVLLFERDSGRRFIPAGNIGARP